VTLEAERDFLLRSLRDLEREHEAGDIDERDYAALRDDYTVRAAAALRAVERDTNVEAGAPPPRRSPRRAIAVIAGVVALASLAGVLVAQSAGERVADRPITGASPTAPPDDLTQARRHFSERRYLDALKLYDKVLARDSDNVEALTYRGWLLFQASAEEFTDRALESLDRAVVVDPKFPDAHFFRGYVLAHGKGDAAAAVPEYRAFLASNPPDAFRQRVEQELNLALCDLGQAPPEITCAPTQSGSTQNSSS
jgi:tetratricopeptide (TPR) repeat protein